MVLLKGNEMVPEKIYVAFTWDEDHGIWKWDSCHKTLQGVLDEVAWRNLDWTGLGYPIFEPWPHNVMWNGCKDGDWVFKIEVKDLLR